MIFRAVFWIGLVSLLAPHEPDLGLGHPGAGAFQMSPSTLSSTASSLLRPDGGCGSGCAGSSGFLARMGLGPDGSVAEGLARVKRDIEADMAARARRGEPATLAAIAKRAI